MNAINSALITIGNSVLSFFGGVGRYVILLRSTVTWMVRPPVRLRLIFRQLEFVGNKSFGIILLSSMFTGAVLGLQIGYIFQIFQAEGLLGATTGKALALELAPVMCGFIVAGRAGAAMAAELGTMRVNEQLDAMEAMGVDPVSYLVVPRVVSSIIMMPILTIMFTFLGTTGAYIVGKSMFFIDTQIFLSNVKWLVWVSDIQRGLVKAAVFGFILSSVSCYKGFYARGGAKGVGEATTQAVVTSLLTILIADFFITYMQMM